MEHLDSTIQSHTIQLSDQNFNLHYLETGYDHPQEEVILLVHGWPTSSYLYRHMMAPLAKHRRVIAIDLPGFGKSDKNPTDSFSFGYHANIIQQFIEKLNINKVHLVVHDLGGPIALWWAQQHREQIASYVILDTIIYPDFSWAVKLFVLMTVFPLIRTWFSSPSGIAFAMKLGIFNKSKLNKSTLTGYQAPFVNTTNDRNARKSLLRSAHRLHIKGFKDIAAGMKDIKQPTCLIYAENDIILPEVSETMKRVADAIPHAKTHCIPSCGHFLQEEKPEAVVKIMSDFYSKTT